ncbi:hypothetical protein [Pseudomonas sp. MWU12-2323]|uniref:hypothetical protein n=1 Tax=Pseudomonas sp. MWU12-2323 TaxID=2651296 RepID=UPI00128BEA14|nr:hypothetical protein [Pseudomonas sp. MWU12-2323]MPQ69338.1 hypothetical protein [Pseudomonas sp. MWU12-2323]
MLGRHECGDRTQADLGLLADVIDPKSVFYKSGTTYYERCLSGELNLMPDAASQILLSKDYEYMQEAGMLNGHQLPMAEILAEIEGMQRKINSLTDPPV